MKLKTTTLIFLMVLIYGMNSSFAQFSYNPGYYVDLNKDTIRGEVLFNNLTRSPKQMKFRQGDQVKVLTPVDVLAFGSEKAKYDSKEVLIDTIMSGDNVDDLTTKRNPVFVSKRLFLRACSEGKLNLYLYKGDHQRDHLFVENKDTIMELVYRRYFEEMNKLDMVKTQIIVRSTSPLQHKRKFVKENKLYIGQLTILMADQPAIVQRVRGLKYRRQDITKLVDSYNHKGGSTKKKKKKK
ncbi:hypothetical protein EYV94_23835 [Puteibacter caeruleilacunae]|nr:hypothetical protein EYV94_23835 [Puteibacter caeruleilacunae]